MQPRGSRTSISNILHPPQSCCLLFYKKWNTCGTWITFLTYQHSSCDFFFFQAYAWSQSIEWIKSKQGLEAKEHSVRLKAIFKACKQHFSEYYKALTRANVALFSHIINRGRNHPGTFCSIKRIFPDVETLVNHSAVTLHVWNHLLNKIWNVTAWLPARTTTAF